MLVIPLTSNIALEAIPGNMLVPVDASGLGLDSVAVVSRNHRRNLHTRGPGAHSLASSDLASAQYRPSALDVRGGLLDLGNSVHKMTQSREKWTWLYLRLLARDACRIHSESLAGNGCSQRVSTVRGRRPEDNLAAFRVPLTNPLRGTLHPLLTGSGPVKFPGPAGLKSGALASSPADEERQTHDDPSHNENLDYHPEVPPKKSTEFHVDHPSIRGHLSALLSASPRPRGRSGQ